jgi:PAS domain S-box-containing protein
MTLRNKILLFCTLIVVFEMGFVGALAGMLRNAEREVEQERKARNVIADLDHVSVLVQKATLGFLTELDTAYDSPSYYRNYTRYVDELALVVKNLRALVSESPEQVHAVDDFEHTARRATAKMEAVRRAYVKHLIANSDIPQTKLSLSELSADASDQSEKILDYYRSLQESGKKGQESSRQQVKIALVVGVVLNLMIAIFLASALTRGIARRLSVINDNSLRLTLGRALNPELQGSDEIASVDKAFHRMATSLREAQARERAVVENAMDIICSIDFQRKFSAINPACREVMGYTQEELMGRRFIDLIVPEDRDNSTATLKQIAVDGAEVPLENQITRKDGSPVHILWSIRWSDHDNTFFCVGHDITERHEIERMKQEFVAIVSHDLSTPLTSIQGTLDLIAEEVIDTRSVDGRKKMEHAQRDVRRLIRLVGDLLNLERMESGKLVMQLEPMLLRSVIENALDTVQVFAEQKNVVLSYDGGEAEAIGDSERLTQVIVNLLSNAIKFSAAQDKVTITCVCEADFCKLSISDNGPGIPKARQKDVFERFKQLDSPDGKRRGGAGLGLAICKSIIDAHDGQIGVDSEEGKGSCFWILVPRKVSSAQGLAP